MIGNIIDAYVVSALLMILLGVIFGVFIARRFKLHARLWWIGAAGFVISQVGHIPFNGMVTQLFAQGTLPPPPPQWSNLFNAVCLGLSSGLFEELTRAAVYRWWAKDARSWRKGLLKGAGWGGIEAILLGALALYTFVYMTAIRGIDLSNLVSPEQLALAQQQMSAYWGAEWNVRLLGALERLLTIPVHIALSVIVLQAFTRRGSRMPGWVWVALAVLWHALLNGVVVYLGRVWAQEEWNFYALEGVIAVFSLVSVGIIFALRRPEPAEAHEAPAATVLPQDANILDKIKAEVDDAQISADDLDSTRYT